jgi:hypothetical protein
MRRDDLEIQVEETVQGRMEEIKNLTILGLDARSPKGLHDIEHALMALSRGLVGEIVEIVLMGIFSDEQWQDDKIKIAKGSRSDLRYVDTYKYKIQTLSGCTVEVNAKYLGPRSEGKARTRKAKKIRHQRGSGLYPAPASMGISHHCTPALMSEISRQVVESSSEMEARESLARRGIDLDIKTVWHLTNLHALDSLRSRDDRMAVVTGEKGEFSGKRVVAAVDGGRIRMRKGNKRGRIPKGKKRRGFKTPWQEPKVLTVYVIDAEGKRDRSKHVIENLRVLADGRNAKKLKTEMNYFIKNASKMKYAWFKRCRLPIGSGAVESCIRRVVNLRMKCPSNFWKEENAEGFLHLRSLYKSGRWDASFMQTIESQDMQVAA